VLLRFAGRGHIEADLVEAAASTLTALADQTGETINLAVAGPLGVEHLAQRDSRHFVGGTNWVGRNVPFHASANGKVLAAVGAARLPAGGLQALTAHTHTDRAALDDELAAVRGRGYAVAVDELEPGLAAVAAPVHAGETVAALSVSGPTIRMSPRRLEELAPLLVAHAADLSARLAHDHDHTNRGAA
jgi:DNA-binding IclR family transcriptional regulator